MNMQKGACKSSHSSLWGIGRRECSRPAGLWTSHSRLWLALSLLPVCRAGPALEPAVAPAEA